MFVPTGCRLVSFVKIGHKPTCEHNIFYFSHISASEPLRILEVAYGKATVKNTGLAGCITVAEECQWRLAYGRQIVGDAQNLYRCKFVSRERTWITFPSARNHTWRYVVTSKNALQSPMWRHWGVRRISWTYHRPNFSVSVTEVCSERTTLERQGSEYKSNESIGGGVEE